MKRPFSYEIKILLVLSCLAVLLTGIHIYLNCRDQVDLKVVWSASHAKI